MLAVMLLSFQAFVQRVPFDISEAETELMEGPLMEYSGPKLALFKYAPDGEAGHLQRAVRGAVCAVGLGAAVPAGAGCCSGPRCSALVLLVTLVAATHARYRIDQAIRYFACLLAVALVALVLASYGY